MGVQQFPTWECGILTAILSCCILLFLAASFYLHRHSDTLQGRRRSLYYLMLSSIGLAVNVSTKIYYVWEFPNLSAPPTYSFQIGFSLTVSPMILRIWRLLCISGPTVDCCVNCTYRKQENGSRLQWLWQKPFVRHPHRTTQRIITRKKAWLHLRLILLMIPSIVLCILDTVYTYSTPSQNTSVSHSVILGNVDFALSLYDLMLVSMLVILAVFLFGQNYRGALIALEDRAESVSLIVYVCALSLYFASDEMFWWIFLRSAEDDQIPTLLSLFVIQTIVFSLICWCTSVGFAAWKTYEWTHAANAGEPKEIEMINPMSSSSSLTPRSPMSPTFSNGTEV